ncbi:hypothetical protein G7Y79_00038g074860 [Physcia stellaris]|nr:hypothetical protein G7Y79_00038g074860 [Physcia stellaris]
MDQLDRSPHLITKFHNSPAIPLVVGEGDEEQILYVHETLLVTTSEYFRVALQSNFIEGQEKRCSFQDDKPYAFHCLVQYLYKGDYNVTTAWPAAEGGEQQSWFLLHAHCFALGNKLVTSSFKKFVVYRLAGVLQNADDPPTMETLLAMARIVYEGTLPQDGHAMRDLLALYYASRLGGEGGHCAKPDSMCWKPVEIEGLMNNQQTEFIVDVLKRVRGSSSVDVGKFMRHHYKKA